MVARAFKQNGPFSKEDQCMCVLDCFGFTRVSLSRCYYPPALIGCQRESTPSLSTCTLGML